MKNNLIILNLLLFSCWSLNSQTILTGKSMIHSEQQVSMTLTVSPEQVWQVISAGDNVDKWLSSIVKSCELKGDMRYCGTAEGMIVERILLVDHELKTYKFTYVEQEMLPEAKELTTLIRIFSTSDGNAIVNYRWSFYTENENEESRIKETLTMMGKMGIKSLENYILKKQN